MQKYNPFSHREAFERNIGLMTEQELAQLAEKLVVIPGCGGVGGLHAQTLARLGVGRFRLADPDTFAIANFNRQIGATMQTLGENKAEVTARMIRIINPDAEVTIFKNGISKENTAEFVAGADLLIDGIDFFALPMRRALFREAWQRAIPALTAAPLGFSGTLHVFTRPGMSFDDYFDLQDTQPPFKQFVNFLIGLAPFALHAPYMDLTTVQPEHGRGPSSIIGVQLAASLAGAEAVRILLGRGPSLCAPHYLQFDAYRQKLRHGHLIGGNRNWLQRLKRHLAMKRFRQLQWEAAFAASR
ncbi:MAG: ThiF family adenylyltransferase [Chromatiales bacterium]|jgi:molybdopterin/thiamine biosynthesis adenylyltransferase